jgi:hypothetical protein
MAALYSSLAPVIAPATLYTSADFFYSWSSAGAGAGGATFVVTPITVVGTGRPMRVVLGNAYGSSGDANSYVSYTQNAGSHADGVYSIALQLASPYSQVLGTHALGFSNVPTGGSGRNLDLSTGNFAWFIPSPPSGSFGLNLLIKTPPEQPSSNPATLLLLGRMYVYEL